MSVPPHYEGRVIPFSPTQVYCEGSIICACTKYQVKKASVLGEKFLSSPKIRSHISHAPIFCQINSHFCLDLEGTEKKNKDMKHIYAETVNLEI